MEVTDKYMRIYFDEKNRCKACGDKYEDCALCRKNKRIMDMMFKAKKVREH